MLDLQLKVMALEQQQWEAGLSTGSASSHSPPSAGSCRWVFLAPGALPEVRRAGDLQLCIQLMGHKPDPAWCPVFPSVSIHRILWEPRLPRHPLPHVGVSPWRELRAPCGSERGPCRRGALPRTPSGQMGPRCRGPRKSGSPRDTPSTDSPHPRRHGS